MIGKTVFFKRISAFIAVLFLSLVVVLCTVPVSADSISESSSAEYGYTRGFYYSKPYILEIGWNAHENDYADFESRTLSLDDKIKMKVLFSKKSSKYLDDKDFSAALTDALTRITSEADSHVTSPVVFSVTYTGDSSAKTLAKQYYNDDDTTFFSTVYPFLDLKTQREYLKKAYDDRSIAFFASCIDKAGSRGTVTRYLQKSYREREIGFFAVCLDMSDDSGIAEGYAEKAYNDHEIAFFSVCADRLDGNALRSLLDKAEKDGEAVYKAVLEDALDISSDDNCEDDYWVNDTDYDKTDLEQQLAEEYAEYDIVKDGHKYYYKNRLVHVFLDIRKDQSIATLQIEPQGKIDIKIIRSDSGEITAVKYMTADEVSELLGDLDD